MNFMPAIRTTTTLLLLSLSAAAFAADKENQKSYVLGAEVAKMMMSQGMNHIDIDVDKFMAGLHATLKKQELGINTQDYNAVLSALRQEINEKKRAHKESQKVENAKLGKAFLEKNKAKTGVKTTATGLQYEIIDPGTGKSPKSVNTVVVHYKGTLIDGTEFDSSYSRNQPARFRLDQVISGWTEGLQLMKEGARYKFYIPSELAYGERGAGHQIGPNSTLVFEVKLIEVVD